MKQLTYPMLQRECVLQACHLGLEKSYQNTESFKFNYDPIYDIRYLRYKEFKVSYCQEDLNMSLDDFAEKIIRPFILSCLTDDLKFIHLECS